MMKYVKQLAVTLLVLLMVGCRSETLQPAAPVLDDNTCGEPTKTLVEIEADAKAGCLRAQYNMGVIYNSGRKGVRQDYQKAFEWYTKAARAGDSGAQNNLALLYEQGNGVEKNLNVSVEWLKKSAAQSNSVAMYNLGMRYYNGVVVPVNQEEGFSWIKKSAFLDYKQAQVALVKLYIRGIGVQVDIISGVAWSKIAFNNPNKVDEKTQKNIEIMQPIVAEVEAMLSIEDKEKINIMVEKLNSQIQKDADPDNETTLAF